MTETWKQVADYSMYDVSDHGRVRSWHNGRWGSRKEPRMMRLVPLPSGHMRISLWRDGKREDKLVHHLVLEAFVGPCQPGMECRHLDGDPANNRLGKLAWGTHSENMLDARQHGTLNITIKRSGESHPRARLTWEQVREIRRLYATGDHSYRKLAMTFGIVPSGIESIVKERTWKE